jgi:glycosyltransferase involved in cell wall biosynthesis
VFVSASAYEGFGLSTIEAMSAATVPVVTAVGAHPNVIEHGVSGFLTDPDATELSECMERALVMSPEEIAAMGEAARTATRRFSWTEIAPQYEQLYRQVLEIRGNAA